MSDHYGMLHQSPLFLSHFCGLVILRQDSVCKAYSVYKARPCYVLSTMSDEVTNASRLEVFLTFLNRTWSISTDAYNVYSVTPTVHLHTDNILVPAEFSIQTSV